MRRSSALSPRAAFIRRIEIPARELGGGDGRRQGAIEHGLFRCGAFQAARIRRPSIQYYMLGLRRSSVTVAAQALQSRRLISYRRGRIQIIDRKGLKAAACVCYEVVIRTLDQFLEYKPVRR